MHQLRDLRGRRVVASDGAAGLLHDLFFDVAQWKVRYLAVESAARPIMERILVPAASAALQADGTVGVFLKRAQVQLRPGARSLNWLWSGRMIARYAVQATDGPAGALDDLVIAPGWLIAAIAVTGAHGEFSQARVALDPQHVARIDRASRTLQVRLSRREVAALPLLSPS